MCYGHMHVVCGNKTLAGCWYDNKQRSLPCSMPWYVALQHSLCQRQIAGIEGQRNEIYTVSNRYST